MDPSDKGHAGAGQFSSDTFCLDTVQSHSQMHHLCSSGCETPPSAWNPHVTASHDMACGFHVFCCLRPVILQLVTNDTGPFDMWLALCLRLPLHCRALLQLMGVSVM